MARWVFVIISFCLLATASQQAQAFPGQSIPSGIVVWQIGKADVSSSEFSDYPPQAQFQQIKVPEDWRVRTDWQLAPKGLRADRNGALDISYRLTAVPKYGLLFSVKLINAPKSGAQMAVFSNRLMAGLLQFWGTSGTASPYRWIKTYRLYIPREMVKTGVNVIRLQAVRPMYSDASVDSQVWFEWDYLKLESLQTPIREPIHGAVTYLGTTLKQNTGFDVNDDTVRMAHVILPWLGIAFSGNTIRADFWRDMTSSQPARLPYLEALRDLNMTVCVDYVSGSHFKNDPDGQMPDSDKTSVKQFFDTYGKLFQYYELGNEPCMFGGGYPEYVQLARYISQVKPSTVKLAAPGWAYGGGKGTPVDWSANTRRRENVESYCDVMNGHSYGYSYADNTGGSFVENLDTVHGVDDGWPKECITTETGTNSWHSEDNSTHFESSQPKIESFDRILRAHLAVYDRTMQHALIFDDFGMFQQPKNISDPTSFVAYPGPDGKDTRLKTFRRLALAYATHGAPLRFVYLNPNDIAYKKVYFRAVDTMAIPAQIGSDAVSNRVLLNLVNFEETPETLKVRVDLPTADMYSGDRYGPGDTYAQAHSSVTFDSTPAVTLSVDLGPGESVQYIVASRKSRVPYAPSDIAATPSAGCISITWDNCSGASSYTVLRSMSKTGPFKAVGHAGSTASFVDRAVDEGNTYWYTATASNGAGTSAMAVPKSVIAGTPAHPYGISAVPLDTSATITWRPVQDASNYTIFRATKMAGPYTVISSAIKASTFTDHNIQNGTVCYYGIKAFNRWGASSPTYCSCIPEAAPTAASGLTAMAGASCVALSWQPSPDADSYTILRSDSSTGNFKPLPVTAYSSDYIDDTVQNGTAYRYEVLAKGIATTGPVSNEVSCQPNASALPTGWEQAQIGSFGAAGDAYYSDNTSTFTVRGAGQNIWGTGDSLHFVYLPLHGDGSLTAHIVHFDDTDPFATVGVMIRQSLDPSSPMANMGETSSHGGGFPHRDTAGAPCDFIGGAAHAWLRIERKGSTLTGFVSDDGEAWAEFGAANVPMQQDTLIGLTVCSHVWDLNRTLFQDVHVGTSTQ